MLHIWTMDVTYLDDCYRSARHTSPGPCLTTVTWRYRKNFREWERSCQRKLRYHWLKELRQRTIAVVRQGPGPRLSWYWQWILYTVDFLRHWLQMITDISWFTIALTANNGQQCLEPEWLKQIHAKIRVSLKSFLAWLCFGLPWWLASEQVCLKIIRFNMDFNKNIS